MSYIYDLADTWNDAATTFTSIKMNVTDTASNAASLLLDLQTGGTSRFSVSKSGVISSIASGASVSVLSAQGFKIYSNGYFAVESAGGIAMTLERNIATGLRVGATMPIGWASTVDAWNNAPDTILTRRAAANLRLGAADAAAPVAQTLSVQSVVAGTTNTAGANLTITGSQGTGTGAGGSIIFQVAPAGSSGTAQNALASYLAINPTKGGTATTGNTVALEFPFDRNGADQTGFGVPYSGQIFFYSQGKPNARSLSSMFQLPPSAELGWNSQADFLGTSDVRLFRDAANTLALRNGANAQTFRVYNTTDGTNNDYMALRWVGNTAYLSTLADGGSTPKVLSLNPGSGARLELGSNATTGVWQVGITGHFTAGTDNTYDIGASGGSRPRNVYVAGAISAGGPSLNSPATDVMRLYGATNGAAFQLVEMTAPAAPGTNNVRIYAEDNGSGKTRLMALFATGAAVQIAIEP